mmetsp:Transcript_9541/g.21838  ORF Transcript_9541/g.21838 Transcript_9541/m.21838 type:complete len:91 (-) Transcript_9541:211-483(-)
MSVQDQDEIIDFLESESAGFEDQEEESHFSEVEEIVAEVDRLERRVESTTFLKTVESASESDSDSSSSDSSSDRELRVEFRSSESIVDIV